MNRIRIVVDDKIPYFKGLFEPFAEVYYLEPSDITPQVIHSASALVIRTRTRCNSMLLSGSQIRFIGTATIGFDHIDAAYCNQNWIVWTNAPGCNADSVAQYIAASLVQLSRKYSESLAGKTIGIVGVGHVGSRVERICRLLGMHVLRNDPPRAGSEPNFVSLDQIAAESDFITFHTPLNRGGEYNTYHLADAPFFSKLKRSPVLLNSARGEVVDTESLLVALKTKQVRDVVMDCWENEPDVHPQLLAQAYIATPHIAGYSADGKANGTRMTASALARFFDWPVDLSPIQSPPPEHSLLDARKYESADFIAEAILHTYDPLKDTVRLKDSPDQFEWQRGHYPLRREFLAYTIYNSTHINSTIVTQLRGLGFKVK